MENFKKNDSTKDLNLNDLSDDRADEQSDAEGLEEKEILKTDT